jgi:LAO/AO transport system kinase
MDATLAGRVLERDARAIARALSLVTDDPDAAAPLVAALHPRTGRAFVVGVTGPPGAGKSTLVDRMISAFRAAGQSVGVLAVDPSSPFTGGAVLGDRVRMLSHASDPGVFIRSLATRGELGGLASAVPDAVSVLDAAGFDVVLVETVGVGQDEVDVAAVADFCLVVLVPGAGDDVQSMKAGLIEIGDAFVVNKADRDGADQTAAAIESALKLGPPPPDGWVPPVVRTIATDGSGVGELVGLIDRFRASMRGRVRAGRLARATERVRRQAVRRLSTLVDAAGLAAQAERVAAHEVDQHHAAAVVVAATLARAAGHALPAGAAVDHVGVAVSDAGPMLAFLEQAFGASSGPSEEVPSQRVRVQFVRLGDASIELVVPTDPSSPVAAFLERRGPGLHHIAVRVEDLAGLLAGLASSGVRLVDDVPRTGALGRAVAFVHPSSTGGVLVELVSTEQPSRADR